MGGLALKGIPVTSTAVGALLLYLHKRHILRLPDFVFNLYLLLLLLNWTNVPGSWHWRVFIVPIAHARFQQLRAYLGLHSGRGSRAKEFGLNKKFYHYKALGIAPQSSTVNITGKVRFGESDLFMHMNNGTYNNCCDIARMKWTIEYFGPALVNEKPSAHSKTTAPLPLNAHVVDFLQQVTSGASLSFTSRRFLYSAPMRLKAR